MEGVTEVSCGFENHPPGKVESVARGEKRKEPLLLRRIVQNCHFQLLSSPAGSPLPSDSRISDGDGACLCQAPPAVGDHQCSKLHHSDVADLVVPFLGVLTLSRYRTEPHWHVRARDAHPMKPAPPIIHVIVSYLGPDVAGRYSGKQVVGPRVAEGHDEVVHPVVLPHKKPRVRHMAGNLPCGWVGGMPLTFPCRMSLAKTMAVFAVHPREPGHHFVAERVGVWISNSSCGRRAGERARRCWRMRQTA